MTPARSETANAVMAENIIRTTKTSGRLEPVREPMTARDYLGAGVLTVIIGALFYVAWSITP